MIEFRAEIVVVAGKHGLDPDLVQALIEQESSYREWAWNPEPKYRYLWNIRTSKPFRLLTPIELVSKFPPHDFHAPPNTDTDQEFWAQQASWGLMQIMGAVAREEGFARPFLTELLTPTVNLEYGCRHLASHFAWARRKYLGLSTAGTVVVRRSALAAYNGGREHNAPTSAGMRNGDYADRVVAIAEQIRRGNLA